METLLLTITLASSAVAVGAGLLSWRVFRRERLRSEARIAALAVEIETEDDSEDHPHPAIQEISSSDQTPAAVDFPVREQAVDVHGGLFSAPRSESASSRFAAVAAAGALVVATIVGGLVLSSGDEPARQPAGGEPAHVAPANVPLELIALGHERESDRLTVRGVVRGRASTNDPRLTAVVLLFDREGEFIASGRAQVGDPHAAPGDDRRFIVSVPGGAQVSRYRVSFRSDEHIVPHVDKRNPVI
jgi:hypothetical protein